MADPSNSTRRVLDVINFLAAHPAENFSLAEVARQVGLSKGSAHRLLTTMSEADFLARDEKNKSYSLGMAAVAVGQAALEKYRGLEIARREMARLTLELDVQCSATVVAGGDLLILAKEGVPQSHEGLNRVGERRPLIPPMGICHVAWGAPALVNSYLALADEHMSDSGYAWLRESLQLIRRRGFAMAGNGPHWSVLRAATVLPIGQERDASYWSGIFDLLGQLTPNEIQLAGFDRVDAHGVASLMAPVFSAEGKVALQLVLSGFAPNASTRKLERYVEKLCATAASITSEMHGRMPRHEPAPAPQLIDIVDKAERLGK